MGHTVGERSWKNHFFVVSLTAMEGGFEACGLWKVVFAVRFSASEGAGV
jgi:hypothetical protein